MVVSKRSIVVRNSYCLEFHWEQQRWITGEAGLAGTTAPFLLDCQFLKVVWVFDIHKVAH